VVQLPPPPIVTHDSGSDTAAAPASIFDDDFFRTPLPKRFEDARSTPPPPPAVVSEPEPSVRYDTIPTQRVVYNEDRLEPRSEFRSSVSAHLDQAETRIIESASPETPARIPSFAGMQSPDPDSGDADELDIPAFLRRGH